MTPAHRGSLRTSLHAHVLSIHLTYDWKPLSKLSSGIYVRPSCERVTHGWLRQGLSIFSPQTLLPVQPALNKLMRKLFSFHIVGFVSIPVRVDAYLIRGFQPLSLVIRSPADGMFHL